MNIDKKDKTIDGSTIKKAIKNGNKRIIKKGADRLSYDKKVADGKTVLHLAVDHNPQIIDFLASFEDIDLNHTTMQRKTVLGYAVQQNNNAAVKALIAAGVDVNGITDSDTYKDTTPLRIAAHNGNLAIAKALVENDANLNTTIKSARLRGSHPNPLFFAISAKNKDIVQYLLKYDNTLVNTEDINGNTPLHEAAYRGTAEILKILLEHGGDPNATNDNNESVIFKLALHDSTFHKSFVKNYLDYFSILLKNGAYVAEKTKKRVKNCDNNKGKYPPADNNKIATSNRNIIQIIRSIPTNKKIQPGDVKSALAAAKV